MKIRPLIKGMLTFVPGLIWISRNLMGNGVTSSARYCYSVWLRHIVMAYKNGLDTEPQVIVEIGPGDSIGTGLAAILSGAKKYYALDIDKHANTINNKQVFEEMLILFNNREDIPDECEFPEVRPLLDSYEFPGYILTENRLSKALNTNRIETIRNELLNENKKGQSIVNYFVPWDESVIRDGSVDMIISQAVLEHVDNLPQAYEAMYRWLKKGGIVSHEIDFKCHGTAEEWNGHFKYSDMVWAIIRGKRSYLINRQPYSKHVNLLQHVGFKLICNIKCTDFNGLKKDQLAGKFKNQCEDDLITCTAFIQAVKD